METASLLPPISTIPGRVPGSQTNVQRENEIQGPSRNIDPPLVSLVGWIHKVEFHEVRRQRHLNLDALPVVNGQVVQAGLEAARAQRRRVGVETATLVEPHAAAPLKVELRSRRDRALFMQRRLTLQAAMTASALAAFADDEFAATAKRKPRLISASEDFKGLSCAK